jgi:DNA-binding response OmpR family regulator
MAVDWVRDGNEALAAAMAAPIDVVVLDVMLPGSDGFEVCRAMRGRRLSTPVLMLTARDSVDDRVRGLEAGADDYLVKPFALRELIARIKALARRHLPDRNSVLKTGQISLDTSAHQCRVGDHVVELTLKEFAILEHLMRNPGRLVTRGQVLEHVWNYDFDGGRNLVEVYIGRLRRKLAQAGVTDPIATVRGLGYRLEARP